MAKYRIYPDNTIDEIDPYEDYDTNQPYHDDYIIFEISDDLFNKLEDIHLWDIPEILKEYIIESTKKQTTCES